MNNLDKFIIEEIIIKKEGGWVFTNDSDDNGGMTYAGLTIDSANKFLINHNQQPMSSSLFEIEAKRHSPMIHNLVLDYYFNEILRNKTMLVLSYPLKLVFATMLTMAGEYYSSITLQRAINRVYGSEYDLISQSQSQSQSQSSTGNQIIRLIEDGKIGSKTLSYLNSLLNTRNSEFKLLQALLDSFNLRNTRLCQTSAFDYIEGNSKKQMFKYNYGWQLRMIQIGNVARELLFSSDNINVGFHDMTHYSNLLRQEEKLWN